MKVLIIHNFYTNFTGEDLLIKEASRLLKDSGQVEIIEYYKYSADFKKFPLRNKIIALIKGNIPFYIPKGFKEILYRKPPDVALVHNTIPFINIWIFKELKRNNIPIIASLYNYRIFCPKGTCFLSGKFCMKCFDKSLLYSVINNCLYNLPHSLLYAYRVFLLRIFLKHIDVFISPEEHWIEFFKAFFINKNTKLLRGCLPISPNFGSVFEQKKDYIIFAGRLIEEKGIGIILRCASIFRNMQFKICGEGPLLSYCRDFIRNKNLVNVKYFGLLKRNDLLQLIKNARILIAPSLYCEFGSVSIEAMLLKTPVIAMENNASVEFIKHNRTGFLFKNNDVNSLVDIIKKVWGDENLRTSVALEAYNRVKEYGDSERYIRNFLAICNGVLNKNTEFSL